MKNILLIDDDETTNFLTRITVKKTNLGKVVYECTNGQEGVDFLSNLDNKPAKEYPDVILLDLNMPILDGWQFLDEFKKMNLSIPIYILSSSNYKEDIENAANYPMVRGYIVKPLSTAKVLEIIAAI